MAQSPCFTPLAESLLSPFFVPFTSLETLLAVTGSAHLGLRLPINWPPLSQPFPIPSPLRIPSTQVKYMRLTTTTSRIRLLLSRTRLTQHCFVCRFFTNSFRIAMWREMHQMELECGLYKITHTLPQNTTHWSLQNSNLSSCSAHWNVQIGSQLLSKLSSNQ